jgi:hypothetical protein
MTLRGYAPSDEDVLQVCNPIFGTPAFLLSSSSLGVVGITGGIGRLSEARWV